MLLQFLIFALALTGLLIAARYFTNAAEQIEWIESGFSYDITRR